MHQAVGGVCEWPAGGWPGTLQLACVADQRGGVGQGVGGVLALVSEPGAQLVMA